MTPATQTVALVSQDLARLQTERVIPQVKTDTVIAKAGNTLQVWDSTTLVEST